MVLVFFVAFVTGRGPSLGAQQRDPQAPVFRSGANLVTVDAYPTQGGKIIKGLTPDDFEVYEDGRPQKVEQLELVDYDAPLPDDDRPVMLSASDGLQLAADPRYRAIVFVLDRQSFDNDTWPPMREALLSYLHTVVDPRDLVALVTTDDPWSTVVFGQRLSAIEEQITDPEWLNTPYREDALVMAGCGMEKMLGRVRADTTFTLLEGLVRVLSQVREDHSSIVFVSNSLARQTRDESREDQEFTLPRVALVNGRIQRLGPDPHSQYCKQERGRLKAIDFSRRFDDLTKAARGANISFYPIAVWNETPMVARGDIAKVRVSSPPLADNVESLIDLAKATDGFAVLPRGDVKGGLGRIAGDVGSHYLLGYYTSNTKADGKLRKISVVLKRTGVQIRARNDYHAPSSKEVKTFSAPRETGERVVAAPVAAALATLSAFRPSAQFFAYGAVAGPTLYVTFEVPSAAVDAGRWSEGAALDLIAESVDGNAIGTARGRLASNGRASVQVPLDGTSPPSKLFVRLRAEGESLTQRVQVGLDRSILVGDPLAFRSSGRGLAVPVASFVFARDQRMRLEWPILKKVDRAEARLLDRYGLPMKFPVVLEDQPVLGARRYVADLTLSSLGRGDYVVELTATAAGESERHYLAFRIE